MKPEMVNSPELYSLRAISRPNSGKPMAAAITDQEAAKPLSKAACAVPTVDLAPMNSDIISTPTTKAGMVREATMYCSLVLLRRRMLIQVVMRM